MSSLHFEQGENNDIAVVLSCPGQDEELAVPQGPAKGQTGTNLNTVLGLLKDTFNQCGFSRAEVMVTNSWDRVEYPEKTKRSEATLQEVLSINNLDRLASEIGNISKYVIACGVNAKVAVTMLEYAGKLENRVKIIYIKHLSSQALNLSIKNDVLGNEILYYAKSADKPYGETRTLKQIRNDNMMKRLLVVAHRINKQINS